MIRTFIFFFRFSIERFVMTLTNSAENYFFPELEQACKKISRKNLRNQGGRSGFIIYRFRCCSFVRMRKLYKTQQKYNWERGRTSKGRGGQHWAKPAPFYSSACSASFRTNPFGFLFGPQRFPCRNLAPFAEPPNWRQEPRCSVLLDIHILYQKRKTCTVIYAIIYIYMPAAVAVCGVLPPFSRCILSLALAKNGKATATMAEAKNEAEMQCPEELPKYTSTACTIRTDNTEAGPENSEETESVREMEEGVPKANKAITHDFDDLKQYCFIAGTLISCVCAFIFFVFMIYLISEKTG